ncbi:MAG: Ser-Thr-rich GPI-anchored membrane family protein [Candidatus Paceibacterota bacterium]
MKIKNKIILACSLFMIFGLSSFLVFAQTFVFNFPTSGAILNQSSSYNITWTDSKKEPSYNLYLLKENDNIYNKYIGKATSSGIFNWLVSKEISTGYSYIIKVVSSSSVYYSPSFSVLGSSNVNTNEDISKSGFYTDNDEVDSQSNLNTSYNDTNDIYVDNSSVKSKTVSMNSSNVSVDSDATTINLNQISPVLNDFSVTPTNSSKTEFGGLITCDGSDKNPCNFNALIGIINNAINWFVGISASIAALTFAYAGAQILFHPDNPAKIEEGKKMLWKTVLGLLIILCSWLVIYTIINTLVPKDMGALRFLE